MNPCTKPIHIASEEEKKKLPEIKDLYIDLVYVEGRSGQGGPRRRPGHAGSAVRADRRGLQRQVHGQPHRVMGGDQSRCGGSQSSRYDIYYAATVQEEVGCRGAGPAAFLVEPEIGIAIDTTLACDVPGIDKCDAISELGKGVALKVMDAGSISHRDLLDEFIAMADEKKIPYQLEILPMGRTDQSSIHQARAGLKTVTLSIPTRYIHTVVESVHKKDMEAAVSLLAAWLGR